MNRSLLLFKVATVEGLVLRVLGQIHSSYCLQL